jgi:hypothetical protein
LGRRLGRGAYCEVSEIANITTSVKPSLGKIDITVQKLQQKQQRYIEDENFIQYVVQDRTFMETHCLRGKTKDCRYALKAVLPSCKLDVQSYVSAVVDLAIEARFLSVICHPNIIKMRAMAETSPFAATQPFFVILDRLYDILGTRIIKWKRQKPSRITKVLDCSGIRCNMFWIERISVAYDLATALQYLHELK